MDRFLSSNCCLHYYREREKKTRFQKINIKRVMERTRGTLTKVSYIHFYYINTIFLNNNISVERFNKCIIIIIIFFTRSESKINDC